MANETARAMAESDACVHHVQAAMDDVAGPARSGERESAAILEHLTQVQPSTELILRLVEPLANASDGLRSQGEQLAHKVGQFRLS